MGEFIFVGIQGHVSPRGALWVQTGIILSFREGRAVLSSGDEYTGSFKGGKPFGKGRMSYQSIMGASQVRERAVYDGDWVCGMRSGLGIMKWTDGAVFEGEWKVDKRYKGKLRTTVGYTYDGMWKDGLFHGAGKLTLKNGVQVECTFSEAQTDCTGRIVYKDGSVYVGSLMYAKGDDSAVNREHRREGKGKLVDSHKNTYEGYFSYDKKNGPGVLRYSNGDIYVGEFMSDKRHGNGQFYEAKKGTLYEV